MGLGQNCRVLEKDSNSIYMFQHKLFVQKRQKMSQFPVLGKSKRKRIFTKPHQINKHLFCCICQEVFEDPVRVQCGHTFCFVCIENWALLKQHCPICRKPFGCRRPEKDLLAIALVDDLQVKCAHQNCGWQGVEAVRNKHQRRCQFKPKNEELSQSSNVEYVEVNDLDESFIEIMDNEP